MGYPQPKAAGGIAARGPSIKFVRVTRDCDYNKSRLHGDGRGIIYDFDVMIDDQRRAQFCKEYTGKGYHLQDADGRAIDQLLPQSRTGRKVDAQSLFEAVISELLDAGKIPTLEEMAAKRETEARAKAEKIAAEKEKMRLSAISTHATDLYASVKEACELSPANAAFFASVIEAIDTKAAEWAARVDAEPGAFGIY